MLKIIVEGNYNFFFQQTNNKQANNKIVGEQLLFQTNNTNKIS